MEGVRTRGQMARSIRSIRCRRIEVAPVARHLPLVARCCDAPMRRIYVTLKAKDIVTAPPHARPIVMGCDIA
jgi:hypothetical protein